MINASNIFSLFNEDTVQPTSNTGFTDFREHPFVLMKLFARMIHRGDIVNKQLIQQQTRQKKVDTEELENLNRYLIYEKAFEYLENINLEVPEHAECIVEQSDVEFTAACEKALEYYEGIEFYERCAAIKDILDFSKFSQNKLQY